jgi:hypothetical protein
VSSHTSLSESDVRKMLELGVEHSAIIERLVETGDWSKSGANEIVRFMTRGPDALMRTSLKLPRPNLAADSSRAGFRRGSWA